MPLKIIRNDITELSVDAIVNAANSELKMGGGVCGAIFSAAGAEKLQAECDGIGGCKTGEAVITGGYRLPARYIIHTVGPIWRGGGSNEAALLHDCYSHSLDLAVRHGLKSVAFPLISSGIYGYPKDQALQIAVSAIGEFLLCHDIAVYLVIYDKKAFTLGEKLFSSIGKYIEDHYADEHSPSGRRGDTEFCGTQRLHERQAPYPQQDVSAAEPAAGKQGLRDALSQLDESFSQALLRLIDEKGLTDVETYKRANIDRKLFSKIRSGKGYNPCKATAVALAVALRLNLDETRDLLGKAGYTLSHSSKFDIIIEYFIEEGNYNIYELNEALFAFDQVLLGE